VRYYVSRTIWSRERRRFKITDYLGQLEVLSPDCNLKTLEDGRGAIFSWVPDDAIREFTLLYFHPNKIRGNHYHPEFIEYFLVLEGKLLLSTVDQVSGNQLTHLVGPGFCFKTPIGVPHAIQAITESTCISLITKPWDLCDTPIIHNSLL
jgi:mannose-6-phosphate isomerase-like protein (cupin superfamily)